MGHPLLGNAELEVSLQASAVWVLNWRGTEWYREAAEVFLVDESGVVGANGALQFQIPVFISIPKLRVPEVPNLLKFLLNYEPVVLSLTAKKEYNQQRQIQYLDESSDSRENIKAAFNVLPCQR